MSSLSLSHQTQSPKNKDLAILRVCVFQVQNPKKAICHFSSFLGQDEGVSPPPPLSLTLSSDLEF